MYELGIDLDKQYEDCQCCLKWPEVSEKPTKQIDIRSQVRQDAAANSKVALEICLTKCMVADPMSERTGRRS